MKKSFLSFFTFVLFVVVIGGVLLSKPSVMASAILVNSNLDTTVAGDGNCTLREAIANATLNSDTTSGDCNSGAAGADVITFSGPMVIQPTMVYEISTEVLIDAASGGVGSCSTKNLGVVLDGQSGNGSSTGFSITGGTGTLIKGFVFQNFDTVGIALSSGTFSNQIKCNIFGLDVTGTSVEPNLRGIHIDGSSGNLIGGTTAGDGNIFGGNRFGVHLEDSANNTVLYGNTFGLDITGTVGFSEQYVGLEITNSDNTIVGDDTPEERNVFSGSTRDAFSSGININGLSDNTTIKGNYFGTDSTGMIEIPNNNKNIEVCDSHPDCGSFSGAIDGLVIGGQDAGEGNLFSKTVDGTGGSSITVGISDISNITIQGNLFGIGSDQTTVLDATEDEWISIEGATNVTIGGSLPGQKNIFGGNADGAIAVEDSENVSVIGNIMGFLSDGITPVGAFANSVLRLQDVATGVVGGTLSGEGNVIALGTNVGLQLVRNSGLSVKGNLIGLGMDGTVPHNGQVAVLSVANDETVTFGGLGSGEANTVTGATNGLGILLAMSNSPIIGNSIYGNNIGINVVSSSLVPGLHGSSPIMQNSIYGNTSGGIDLSTDTDSDVFPDESVGQTVNDIGDGDSGPNGYLNHPVILTVNTLSGEVTYALDVPTGNYRVEFFKNPTEGLSETFFGEGETFLDSDSFTSTGTIAIKSKTLSLSPGDVVTATVTEDLGGTYGSTSEFSNSVPFGVDVGTATGTATLISDNGAYHIITNKYLGTCVNADSGDGTNKDSDGPVEAASFAGTGPCLDDRDGVVFDKNSYSPLGAVSPTVTASHNGYISVWADLNADGDFSDGDEWFVVERAITAGANKITFEAPSSVGDYNIRFRYTSYEYDNLLSVGEALDGEVEDYVLTVTSSGGGGTTGGSSDPYYACRDPKALNYSAVGVHDEKLCTYETYIYTVDVTDSRPETDPNPPVGDSYSSYAATTSCPFKGYHRRGAKGPEINKIQEFLNKELTLNLVVSGVYDRQTENAIKLFQKKYTEEILLPWHPPLSDKPTGRWYKTTRMKANQLLGCQEIPVVLEDNGTVWQLLVKSILEKAL